MLNLPSNPAEGDEKTGHFGLHHVRPLRHGGIDPAELSPFALAPVDVEAACQPVNPGFPPLRHVPLPPPETFRPHVPPFAGDTVTPPVRPAGAPARPPLTPTERVPFPVAQPPTFQRLTPAPTVVEQPAPAAPSPAPAPAPVSVRDVRRATPVAEPSVFERIDPLYALLVYLALGLGTWVMGDLESRYTLLWTILSALGVGLTLFDARGARARVNPARLVWGLGSGFLIGLVLLVFAQEPLAATSRLLFPYATPGTLFQTLVFLSPIGETLFFRGALQERRGMAASIIGAGMGTLILFMPAGAGGNVIYLAFVALSLTALAGVYSYIRQRYGLAAAYLCQVTLNLMVLFLPTLLTPPMP